MKNNVARVVVAAVLGAVVGARLALQPGWRPSIPDFGRMTPSVLLWVAFFLYWAVASRNQAPTKSGESSASTLIHQVLLAGAMLLLLFPTAVPGLRGRFLPATPLWVVVGGVVQAAFLLLGVWARRHLGSNWSAEVRIAVDHQLVRSGPYARIRHPIYTAMLGMFVGTAIASGTLQSLLAVLVLAIAYWRKTALEEGVLQQTFGADFTAYRQSTWALIPGVY